MSSRAFPTYNNLFIWPSYVFSTMVALFRVNGIGIIGIPNDFFFAGMQGYYLNGIMNLNGPILYYYPANVVGIWWPPNNNTMYYVVYAFGADCQATNYVFVKASTASNSQMITFFNQIP